MFFNFEFMELVVIGLIILCAFGLLIYSCSSDQEDGLANGFNELGTKDFDVSEFI